MRQGYGWVLLIVRNMLITNSTPLALVRPVGIFCCNRIALFQFYRTARIGRVPFRATNFQEQSF